MSGPFGIREIPAEATRPLRHEVLRPGAPEAALVYPGDDAPATRHFAAFAGSALVGVASLYAEEHPDAEVHAGLRGPVFRLRGMATAPAVRGRGAGGALLEAALDHARASGAALVWCNARVPARGFYARFGFAAVGPEFTIPGIGRHLRMHRAP